MSSNRNYYAEAEDFVYNILTTQLAGNSDNLLIQKKMSNPLKIVRFPLAAIETNSCDVDGYIHTIHGYIAVLTMGEDVTAKQSRDRISMTIMDVLSARPPAGVSYPTGFCDFKVTSITNYQMDTNNNFIAAGQISYEIQIKG